MSTSQRPPIRIDPPNPAGHERIAAAAAQELGLTGADGSWSQPLPPAPASRPCWTRTGRCSPNARTPAKWVYERLFNPSQHRRQNLDA